MNRRLYEYDEMGDIESMIPVNNKEALTTRRNEIQAVKDAKRAARDAKELSKRTDKNYVYVVTVETSKSGRVFFTPERTRCSTDSVWTSRTHTCSETPEMPTDLRKTSTTRRSSRQTR